MKKFLIFCMVLMLTLAFSAPAMATDSSPPLIMSTSVSTAMTVLGGETPQMAAQTRNYSRTLSAVAEQARVDDTAAKNAKVLATLVSSENDNLIGMITAAGQEVPYVVISPTSSDLYLR